MFKEGQRVAYIGEPPEEPFAVGDEGKVLAVAGSGAHIQWLSGARAGEITLERLDDLTPLKKGAAGFSEGGALISIAVRDVYTAYGPVGLINALNDEGHMADWVQHAEEAMNLVSKRIRQDPSMREVLAQLDDDEGEEIVSMAAQALLRDAFSGAE